MSEKKSELDALFDILVPPDAVTIEDVAGNRYTVPGRIPAGRQIVVMRLVREILVHRAATDTMGAMAGVGEGPDDIARAFGHAIMVLSDETLIKRLAEAFVAAHPSVVEEARAKAKGRGEGGDLGPIDLFSIEEMGAALAPLFVRLGRRLFDGLRGMAPAAQA